MNVLPFIRHYKGPHPHVPDKSANVCWTRSLNARHYRALAVWCMPTLMDVFPIGQSKAQLLESPAVEHAWRQIVGNLKCLGLLAPTTAAIDVAVDQIVSDARELSEDEQALNSLMETTRAFLDELEQAAGV
jgi:hypothetical protein